MTNQNISVDPVQDQEIALTCESMTLYVSAWGASLRGLVANGDITIATRYIGASAKMGGEGDVLIPFPGRIKNGSYAFQGHSYQLVKSDSEGPNAIHGFLRHRAWNIVEQTTAKASFETTLSASEAPGYPFALNVKVIYEVNADGIEVNYAITNMSEMDAPVAAGFHPYFTLGTPLIDECSLTVPFKSYLAYESLIPTGEVLDVAGHPLDFKEERQIGTTSFNNCYLNPIRDIDGKTSITLSSNQNKRSISVVLGPEIDYVVLYSGDVLPDSHRRRALAIEPMSCGSDAFNHPEWGLAAVKPGDSLTGSWSVIYKSR